MRDINASSDFACVWQPRIAGNRRDVIALAVTLGDDAELSRHYAPQRRHATKPFREKRSLMATTIARPRLKTTQVYLISNRISRIDRDRGARSDAHPMACGVHVMSNTVPELNIDYNCVCFLALRS
jgi:hypothetical protein